MKHTGLFVVATVALALASCQKPVAKATTEPPPLEVPPPVVAPIAPAPEPLVAAPIAVVAEPPAPVAPPTPVRELAPAGIYYLRAKKSLTTDDGIVGFAPGIVLRETAPGEYATPDNQTLKLAAHEITNDLAEARQLAGYSAAIRAAQSQGLRTVLAAEAPKEAAAAPISESMLPATARRPMRSAAAKAPPAAEPTGLNRGAYGEKKVFIDKDGDGRAFEIRKGSQ